MMPNYPSCLLCFSRLPRIAASAFLAVWLSATQATAFGSSTLFWGQEDSKGLLKSSGENAKLSDKEVLKLQAEKRDSIDRLERTAAEIARKWRERQDQDQPSEAGQSQTPQAGVIGSTDLKDNPATKQEDPPGQNSMGQNPLLQADRDPLNTEPSNGNQANSESAGTMKTAEGGTEPVDQNSASPDLKSDQSVKMASASNIVDGPIDRLALATSLYATNQFRECLKILEAVEIRPLSVEDQQWHDYLAASSYRKLGDRGEAEDYYRSVLQRSSSTWVSTAARWWLGHIDEKSQLELKLEKVQTTIANWRKEIDVLKSAN